MEYTLSNLGKKVESIEEKLDKLIEGFSEFGEFTVFVKNQFERQEKILESVSADIKDLKVRTGNIGETLAGIQQAFLFKSF